MSVPINRSMGHFHGFVRGFTLIELLVTIAVLAVLATIALPNFATSIRNARVTSETNDLLTAINLARNEAITRTRGVSVCAADTKSGVPTACGAAADWSKGWVVFLDSAAGTTSPTTITASSVIRTWIANGATTITPDPTSVFLRFSSRGESVVGPMSLSVVPSDKCTNQQQRLIEINSMGRASSAVKDCP